MERYIQVCRNSVNEKVLHVPFKISMPYNFLMILNLLEIKHSAVHLFPVAALMTQVIDYLETPRKDIRNIKSFAVEIRDITADLLSEVCHSIGTEPCLQEITEEWLTHRTANRQDGARLDIVEESFLGKDWQCAFFDVRVSILPRKAIATLPWVSFTDGMSWKR